MVSMSKLLISWPIALRLQRAGAFTIHRSSLHSSSCLQIRKTLHHVERCGHFTDFSNLQFRNNIRSFHQSTSLLNGNSNDHELRMENIYMEWSIEDDEYLSKNMKNKSLPKLASTLGRGLRGVESRMAKLNDVNSQAYQRSFVKEGSVEKEGEASSQKLMPANEVMGRIKWDYSLDPNDFTVEYFDRVEETIFSTPFVAKNDSVKGKEEMFVFAIPEHRIMVIKYKERVVWDKEKRVDRVFGSMNGNGETIDKVQATYNEWVQKQSDIDEYNKAREREMAFQLKTILGEHLFAALKDISSTLQNEAKIRMMEPQDIDDYVQDAVQLFRKARAIAMEDLPGMPQNDIEALDLFSNLVALLPDDELRERILNQIFKQVISLDPSKRPGSQSGNNKQQLPDLDENDLIETFVRASGAGGQKVNKTSSKVLLIHEPSQIRVECQDTRSLQQNRKIARKRMQLKLDEYLNGSQSKTQVRVMKKVDKKQKQKARNKSRLRKKMAAQDSDESDNENSEVE